LKRNHKQEILDDLKSEFSHTSAAVLVDYRGLNCETLGVLRRELRNSSAELRVVKNSLLRIASKGTAFEKLNDFYHGPTAITLIKDDPVAASKVLVKYVKELKMLELKGGILKDKLLDINSLESLSKLPSREVLLSQLLSVMNGPMRGFATVLSGVPRGFVTALSALKEKKEKELN
jgi:large subunit ribosomal protein L10